MAEPLRKKSEMSLAEFLDWYEKQPGRFEFADGEIIAMAPGRVRHNVTKGAAFRALGDAVAKAKLPCIVLTDGIGVAIDGKHWREPDAVVHCGTTLDPDAIMVDRPIILVEVDSPSSERDDTTKKLVDYFTVETVSHYVIVDAYRRVIVHHARDAGGRILTSIVHAGELALDPPGLTLRVSDLLPVLPEVDEE